MRIRSRSIPIRVKLICITVLAVWGGATINSAYISYRETIRAQEATKQRVLSISEYVVFSATPAMVFEDNSVLNEALSGLQKSPELLYAKFTNPDGQELASFHRTPSENSLNLQQSPPTETTVDFRESQLHVIVPMKDQDEIVGYFYMGVSLKEANKRIREDALIALFLNVGVAAVFTFLMMWFLTRVVFRPMYYLDKSTKEISQGNFTIESWTRRIQTHDEMGKLAQSFERMAHSLNENSQEIIKQNQELKDREQRLGQVNSFLSTYLPKQFVKSVMDQNIDQSVSAPQRNRLTVFFSDLQGFTSLTDQLDPEALFTLLNEYQNAMNHIVNKYDGTLDKYMGDGLMVFFGSPQSRGQREDALRCCLMAIEMQNSMADLQNTWFYNGIESPMGLRIGVHTGFSAVGSFGTESRLDYTAIGPVVNIASRLEGASFAGQVKVSHQTWANIEPFIRTQEVEAITPKGLTRPMKTYVIQGVKPELLVRLKEHELSDGLYRLCETALRSGELK